MILFSYYYTVDDDELSIWIESHTHGQPPWWGFEVDDKEATIALLKWGKHLTVHQE